MVWGRLDRYVHNTKLDHVLAPHTRTSSKRVKDLHLRFEDIKLLGENKGSKILNISLSHIFFYSISLGKGNKKKKINKWNYIKVKRFCTSKDTIIEMKRQPTEWEDIFSNDDKRLISKIYKEFISPGWCGSVN